MSTHISLKERKHLQGIVESSSPGELYTLAKMVRDTYREQVRNNFMELDPKLMRIMDENVERFRKQAH